MNNNVRFFLGSREQYNAISKYNPLALYFCVDTGELFRGEQCLSAGVRIVEALPNCSQAADGILYYIEADGDGYVVSPSRDRWIKVIGNINVDFGKYVTKEELELKGYITDVSNKADINHTHNDLYETKGAAEAVKNDLLNGAGAAYDTLKELGELIDNNVEAIDALREIATDKANKEHEHTEYVTNTILDSKGYLTEHQSLTGYATEEYVTQVIERIEIPAVDLSGYAKKSELPVNISQLANDANYLTAVPEEYVTESELEAKGYITAHQDISNKADNILFTEDMFVTKALGNFTVGESVKGITLAELLAKLLGLSKVNVNPDVPEEQTGIVANILTNELPMYTVNTAGELIEIPFNYMAFNTDTAALPPTVSGFYQIKDSNGNVIESGYQELQIDSEETYYVIALPKEIDFATTLHVQAYSNTFTKWMDDDLNMTSDSDVVASICSEADIDTSKIDTDRYTIWALEECPTGRMLRFIINE